MLFAFSSDGVREPRDFVRNAARAVKEGLAPEAAIRALTINAARIAGADATIGSLERGKIANLVVTDGDLFEDRTRVRHVFVDGRPVDIEETRRRPPPDEDADEGTETTNASFAFYRPLSFVVIRFGVAVLDRSLRCSSIFRRGTPASTSPAPELPSGGGRRTPACGRCSRAGSRACAGRGSRRRTAA